MPEPAFDRTIHRRGDTVYGYDIYAHVARKAVVRVVHVTESERGITVHYHLDPVDGMIQAHTKKVRKFPQTLEEEHVFPTQVEGDEYARAKRVREGWDRA